MNLAEKRELLEFKKKEIGELEQSKKCLAEKVKSVDGEKIEEIAKEVEEIAEKARVISAEIRALNMIFKTRKTI